MLKKPFAAILVIVIFLAALATGYFGLKLLIKSDLQKKYDAATELGIKQDLTSFREMQSPLYFYKARDGTGFTRDEEDKEFQGFLDKNRGAIQSWRIEIKEVEFINFTHVSVKVKYQMIIKAPTSQGEVANVEPAFLDTWSRNSGKWELESTDELPEDGG